MAEESLPAPDQIQEIDHHKRRVITYFGDSPAMPVHWYCNPQALKADYGRVTDYPAPHTPHPDRILRRSTATAPTSTGEILHDQAA